MSIYISKGGQQSGPFEENVVIDQLKSGELSPDDMGIRQGDTGWRPLRTIFPQAVPPPAFDTPPVPEPASSPIPAPGSADDPAPIYRKTTLQKVFFGLCLLVALLGFAAAAYYLYTLMGSSGDLQADLSRMSFRILARNAAAGGLVGAFFAFLAFVMTFKRKIIGSNGPRLALRVFFILVLLIGLGNLAYGALSYFTYRAPYSSKSSESNELLKALEQGTAAVAPYEMAVIFLPIGAGLFLFGLSGILMTKKLRTE